MEQTHHPRGFQCQSGNRSPNLWKNDWKWRSSEVQQQWLPPFNKECRAWTTDHQHSLPSTNSQQWMRPCSKHWHLIDYVMVRKKNRQDVRVIKTMCGADCWTDHRRVSSKLNLRIQSVRWPQCKKVLKRLEVSKLKQDSKRQAFINDICSRLDTLKHSSEDIDESWTVFRDTVHSSAMDFLGPVSRKHQDWFDENDKKIHGVHQWYQLSI